MRKLLVALLALLIAVPPAYAQERKTYGQAELDQMLAPVALYSDALLSQVLMAATYPLEIVEAARWSRANPGIQGDEAVGASGGVYGLLLAYGVYFPQRTLILLFPPIPLPARVFVVLFAALELYFGVTGTVAGVAHFAHLGGMLGGWMMIRLRRRRRGR